jgi:hypothetical protein
MQRRAATSKLKYFNSLFFVHIENSFFYLSLDSSFRLALNFHGGADALTMLRCLKWTAFLFVYIAALSRCNFATASATQRHQLSRNDLLHPRASKADPFCTSALRNLTEWKSSLYRRTMDLYKATERRLGAVSEPLGHARFSLFSPFVTCINQGTLMRVGNNEDGMNSLIFSRCYGARVKDLHVCSCH